MLRVIELIRWVLGRLYGLVFVGLGGVFLYWSARGFIAYSDGVRVAWSEPAICAVGIVVGGLSLWVAIHFVRSGIPESRHSSELDALVDAAMKLERTDPAAAHKLLDPYFMREAAATEARRVELRRRASHDHDAAVELRRELAEDLETNALRKRDALKKAPADRRAAIVAEIDAADRAVREELLQLDTTIQRLAAP